MTGAASPALALACAVVLAVYAAAVLLLVIRGARKTRSIRDYAVGSVSFSPVFVGLSLAASMTSAATFIINPGLIALFGVSGVICLAVVLPVASLTSLVVLTKGFRRHGASVQAMTMSQWIGTRFGSEGFSRIFAVLSLLLLTFVVLICVGLTKVLAWSLGVEQAYVLAAVVLFVFGYMAAGGANSMVYTNALQAGLMIVVAFILLGSGYEHFAGGVAGFLDSLAAIDPNLASPTNPTSFLFRDWFEVGLCTVIVGVAIICQPHIITKSLLLRSDRDVNRYLAVAVVVEALFFAVVIAGLYARLEFPDLTLDGVALRTDDIMAAYVVREFPVYAAILVILGLMSAGISTLEGLIQSLSTTITADILRPLLKSRYPAEEDARALLEVRINRGVIGALAAVSAALSWDQIVDPSVSVAIFAQNGVYAYFAAAFMPTLLGIFAKDTPRAAAMAASLTAVVVHFGVYYGRLTPYMQTPVRNPGVAAALAIVASAGVGAAVLVAVRRAEASAASAASAASPLPAAPAAPAFPPEPAH